MMNKKIIAIVLVLIAFFGFFLLMRPSKVKPLDIKQIQIENQDTINKNIQKKMSPLKITQAPTQKKSVEDTNIVEKNNTKIIQAIEKEQITLFETLSIDEAKEMVKPRKRIMPISAITIDQNIISSLRAKDKLVLPDIEGIDYAITISDVQKNNDGSISSRGFFVDEGIRYTSTITHGKNVNYITLATPNGMYEIETNRDAGYIYKTEDIRKILQTSKKNDMIKFPIPQNANKQ